MRKFGRRFWLGWLAGGLLVVGGGAGYYFAMRPTYAWVNFGPQARLQLLLRDHRSGKTVTQYLDGRPVGDALVLADWDTWPELALRDPEDQTTYQVQRVSQHIVGQARLMIDVHVEGPLACDQYCDLPLAAGGPAKASVAHFGGRLVVAPLQYDWKLPADFAFVRGGAPLRVAAYVGTFDRARNTWTVVRSHDREQQPIFPSDVRPVVEIRFPPASVDSVPIVERYALDEVCCGPLYYRLIATPAGIGTGNAEIRYTFPNWPHGTVDPSTLEVPVVDSLTELAATAVANK